MRFGTKQSLLAAATGILAVSCVIGPEGAYDAEIEEAVSLEGAITIDTSAVYTIVGVQSGKCVQVAGGSTADAAAMQIASCNGSTRQQFRMESAGGAYYRIRNVNSNRCMDVAGASTSDGAAIQQYSCWTGQNQQWSFTDVAGGVVRLTARHSGKSLDVHGRGTADGTAVIQWASNGATNQQFRLTPVGSGTGGTGGTGGGGSTSGTSGTGGTGGTSGTGGTGGTGGSGGSGGSGGGGGSGGTRSAGCGIPTSLTSGNRTINVNGTTRQYVLDIPANYDPNRAHRLVFGWHWRGGSANDVVNNGYYGLKALANGSAIFVSPNGIDNGWANTGGRDIAFARAMVDSLKANLCVDTSRVFSTGWSFGGMMSNAIGCDMPDVFRAIAPMSGALYSGCNQSNTQPVAVWMSHGLSDSVVPVSAGRAALDVFVRKNGCSTETSPVGPSSCVAYQGCREGYPVHRCEFAGDHQTPSFASSAIWNFFTQF
ncbi:RICIN domain-containing protein [Sorangium sp. So ce887]|uniref:RICIN domain-containing protein n=1 Tax=Sorangium sp. So ce887 TaxID=3133324 RepID=UPI003F5E74A3